MFGYLMIIPFDALVFGGSACLAGCFALVFTQRWHGRWSLDGVSGAQKFHTAPTPRIAGIAVLLGVIVGYQHVPNEVAALLWPMLIAGLPAFLFGLIEDLTKKVGVRQRLFATIGSGILACLLTGVSISHVGVWGVDYLLAWPLLSVLFTAVAIGGVANSINIIDGFNGLAAGVVIVCLGAFGGCSYLVGDTALLNLCAVLAAVVAGFVVINFPLGKIFLGDGGAYLIGFWVGWIAVLLPMRNPGVSPWASLLICSYPVLEVLFSVMRRYRRNLHPGHPDRLHLHSLIKTRLVAKRFFFLSPILRNAAVSPMAWGLACGPSLVAMSIHGNQVALMSAFFISGAGYAAIYRRLVRFRWFL